MTVQNGPVSGDSQNILFALTVYPDKSMYLRFRNTSDKTKQPAGFPELFYHGFLGIRE